jgi:hypothetical protein
MTELRYDTCPACNKATLAPVTRDPFDRSKPDPRVTARACLNSECLAVQELVTA